MVKKGREGLESSRSGSTSLVVSDAWFGKVGAPSGAASDGAAPTAGASCGCQAGSFASAGSPKCLPCPVGTAEGKAFNRGQLDALVDLAAGGITQIVAAQRAILAEPPVARG